MNKNKKQDKNVERCLMRLAVLVVDGIIFYFWNILMLIVFIIQLIITLVSEKPNKELLAFSKMWIKEITLFINYILFVSEEKPIPFR